MVIIWGNTYEATLDPIIVLQKMAVRLIITFSCYNAVITNYTILNYTILLLLLILLLIILILYYTKLYYTGVRVA